MIKTEAERAYDVAVYLFWIGQRELWRFWWPKHDRAGRETTRLPICLGEDGVIR